MYTYEIYMKSENGLNLLNKNSSDIAEFAKKAEQDGNGNNIEETYAKKSLYGDTTISVGREEGTEVSNSYVIGYNAIASGQCSHSLGAATQATGDFSHAENYMTKAIGIYSHSEGRKTETSGECSHAEGNNAKANGNYSHAEGNFTKASGACSHAEGSYTEASGACSHAEGNNAKANGNYSHAEGSYTEASGNYSHACGKYNALMISGGDFANNNGTAFVVGNGTSESIRSNAFSIQFDGITKAASTITSETTADYAEFFEWEDNNANAEDRVGKFVTLHDDKITVATSNEDYILGIVSGAPFVLGNGDCDVWTGMWLRDDFNRVIYEPAPKMEFDEETKSMKEVFDDDGNLVYEGKRRKLNPDYDSSQKYISRFDRPEWDPVGMLGVLSVIQDGTCKVNGYCCCNSDGIATACDRNTVGAYRVIKKISDRVVRVVFR